jgi:hypothetical protein
VSTSSGGRQAFRLKVRVCEWFGANIGENLVPREGIRCKELGNNLFLFTFLQSEGKRRAITEGSWEFGGDLLIVVDFDESKKLKDLEFIIVVDFDDSKRLKDLEFISVPVWIRVFDLPLGLMNEETVWRIGNKVGRFLEVYMDEDVMVVGEFLQIKVLLDVRKPLFRGITLEDGEGKGEGWCSFKYEFLPNFCYVCGHLGHVEKECDEGVWHELGKQFGEWLRVTPTRKKDGRGEVQVVAINNGKMQVGEEAQDRRVQEVGRPHANRLKGWKMI